MDGRWLAWGALALGAWAGCAPGSGFDDRPAPKDGDADADADSDADADADADSDADTDTSGTGGTGATGETGGETGGDTGLPPPGEGLVNEVLASPPTNLAGDSNCDGARDPLDDEFIELVNLGAEPLPLGAGQILVDGTLRHGFPSGFALDPGATLVVFGGGSPTFDGSGASGGWCAAWPPEVLAQTASTGGLSLPNTGGTVRVVDGYGRIVNEVDYGLATNESTNRRPELQDVAMVPHTTLPDAIGAFSPGTLADGLAILGGPDETGDTGLPFGTVATIEEAQTGAYAVGTELVVSGIVTGVASDGVYLEDAAGGPYSGVWVHLGANWAATWGAIAEGDALDVTGQLQEPLGNTTIDVAASAGPSVVSTGSAAVPAPHVVGVSALVADPEPWEGVLVELGACSVAATGLAGDAFTVSDLGDTEVVSVDDQIALYSGYAGLVVGARFDAIRGPLYSASGAFHVAPRSDADVVAAPPLVLRINEVLGDPPALVGDANCDGALDAAQDDFVEIWNLGTAPVPLAGITLADTTLVRHAFSPSLVLDPGGAVVVFGGGAPVFDGSGVAGTWCTALPASVHVEVASTGSLGITNTGDTLAIGSGALTIDSVGFGAEIASDRSLNRDPDQSTGPLTLHDAVPGAVNAYSPGTTVGGVPSPYRATIAVDGDPADFPADSAFTTSAGTTAHLAWSATTLYVSLAHPAVAAGPDEVLVLYFGGGSGPATTTGLTLGGQTPTLPFAAAHAVRWATDDSTSALSTWNGTAWVDNIGWLGTSGSSVADDDGTQVVELGVPFAPLALGPTVDVVLAVVDTTTGAESTVAGLPSTAFTDGASDPDYAEYFELHPHLAAVPNSYPPVP